MPLDIFLDDENKGVGSFKTGYLAEQIINSFPFVDPGPVGVTTVVNLADLDEVSDFGLILSEQIMSELSIRGFSVMELRQGQYISFKDGETVLTRREASIRGSVEIGVLVVGTYMVGEDTVWVNVRVIDPKTSEALGAGSVEIERDDNVSKLLRKRSGKPVVESVRIRQEPRIDSNIFR